MSTNQQGWLGLHGDSAAQKPTQDRELKRVGSTLHTPILRFRRLQGSNPFRLEDVEKFCAEFAKQQNKRITPGSAGRILRQLKRNGHLNYKVIDRSRSLYQFMGENSD